MLMIEVRVRLVGPLFKPVAVWLVVVVVVNVFMGWSGTKSQGLSY